MFDIWIWSLEIQHMLPSFMQLIEDSWFLYGKHYRTFLPGMIIIFILAFISPIFDAVYQPSLERMSEQSGNFLLTYAILAILMILVAAFVSFLFLRVMHAVVKGKKISWSGETHRTFPIFFTTFVVTLIVAAVTFIGTVVFVIPGIILFVFLFFSQYYALFENTSIIESLRKGWHLVQGRWLAVAIRLLIPILMIGIIQILLTLVLDYLTVQQLFTDSSNVILSYGTAGFFHAIVATIFYPWLYGTTILLFISLKKTPHV